MFYFDNEIVHLILNQLSYLKIILSDQIKRLNNNNSNLKITQLGKKKNCFLLRYFVFKNKTIRNVSVHIFFLSFLLVSVYLSLRMSSLEKKNKKVPEMNVNARKNCLFICLLFLCSSPFSY